MAPTPSELVRVLLMLLLGGVVYDRFVVDVIETRLPPGHGVTFQLIRFLEGRGIR